MTLKILALVFVSLALSGCGLTQDRALEMKCKELIEDSLVSPASADFVRSVVYRRVETTSRQPKEGPTIDVVNEMRARLPSEREVQEIDADLANPSTRIDGIRRNREYLEKLREYERVLSEHIEKTKEYWRTPHGEVHWELDAQNRAGAVVRIAAACTFVDDGNEETLNQTFELSVFGEGRIPAEPPNPFGTTPRG